MNRPVIYYRVEPDQDRWISGDRFIRPLIRRLVRGKPQVGGVDKVFANLVLGLERLGLRYAINLPFDALRDDDSVAVLGRGRYALKGYARPNRIIAGIGLMTHPSEWPTLCDDFPVVRYLQHSEWAKAIYRPYFGDRCGVWPVGIDTEQWKPRGMHKNIDFLVYDKVRWNREHYEPNLISPILENLHQRNLKYAVLRYGSYSEQQFAALLARSKAMLFLCEHESQGLAYQECLSSDVPILAWDQGWCLDPNRDKWGTPCIPATSVPYFDQRCGTRFANIEEFEAKLDAFLGDLRRGEYKPRAFIMDNLTLERQAQAFVEILRADLES